MNYSIDNTTCVTQVLFHEFEKMKMSVREDQNMVFKVVPFILLPISLLLLTVGHIIIRPAYAVIGFFVGSISTIQILYYMDNLVPCHIAVASTLAVGLSKAIASGFLIRASAVILGIVSGFVIAFSVFIAFPVLDGPFWPDAPIISGYRLFPSWSVSTLVGLIFGIICFKKYKEVSIIITSTMGAYGFAFSIALFDTSMTDQVQMIIFAFLTVAGVLFQIGLKRYRKKMKERVQESVRTERYEGNESPRESTRASPRASPRFSKFLSV